MRTIWKGAKMVWRAAVILWRVGTIVWLVGCLVIGLLAMFQVGFPAGFVVGLGFLALGIAPLLIGSGSGSDGGFESGD